jgi:hypothetical protein
MSRKRKESVRLQLEADKLELELSAAKNLVKNLKGISSGGVWDGASLDKPVDYFFFPTTIHCSTDSARVH